MESSLRPWSCSTSVCVGSMLVGQTREEPSFSVSMIILLISVFWKDSQLKMWPSLILSADNFLRKLEIWCWYHSFSWLRRCFQSRRMASIRYRLSLEVMKALRQYSFSARSRSTRVSSFSLSVLRLDSFLLADRMTSWRLFLRRNCFSFLSWEAVSRLREWISRLGLRVMASVLGRELSLCGSVGGAFCFVLLLVLFLDLDLLLPLCLLGVGAAGGYLTARTCRGSVGLDLAVGLGCRRLGSTTLFMQDYQRQQNWRPPSLAQTNYRHSRPKPSIRTFPIPQPYMIQIHFQFMSVCTSLVSGFQDSIHFRHS